MPSIQAHVPFSLSLFSLTLLLYVYSATLAVAFTATPDVIIVGAGTSGCALAARLCVARPDVNILLLERGQKPNATQSFLKRSPRQMWNSWETSLVAELFPTDTNPWTNNRSHMSITGATLGGTSAINGRQWVVPLRGSVEKWGIKGLTTDSARTYYTRAFRTVAFDRQRVNLRHKYAEDFIAAAEKTGYPLHGDPFDTEVGKMMFENRLAVDKQGFNVNSCDAYLTPALKQCNNLKLRQGVTVSRVLMKNQSNTYKAIGIEYIRTGDGPSGKPRKLFAKKEVISCSGPFGSPKLLQLSGIGPKNVLAAAGVTQKINVPVGAKTQSRNFVSISALYTAELEPSNNSSLVNSATERVKWENGDGGVLGIHPFFANGRDGARGYLTGTGSWFSSLLDQKIIGANCNGNVDSFGYLEIISKNAFVSPKVNFALLKSRKDVTRLLKCLKMLNQIMENMPKQKGFKVVSPRDGQVTEKFIRDTAGWAGHFVAGCPVGSVLEDDFKVKGVEGLRVVDSSSLSVMPASAGPMASVYMIAEYAVELIASHL